MADDRATTIGSDIEFKDLILGLSGAALHHLGETNAGKDAVNFPLARHNIEIIAMLIEKTKGNLTPDEESTIHQVLLDLRIRFIEKSKKAASK